MSDLTKIFEFKTPRTFNDIFKHSFQMDMACTTYQEDDKYIIEMDVPGFDKENLTVEYDTQNYIIKVFGKTDRREITKSISTRYEYSVLDEATVTNGILKLTFFKTEESEAVKKIEIK